jgi:hypothetical protein
MQEECFECRFVHLDELVADAIVFNGGEELGELEAILRL